MTRVCDKEADINRLSIYLTYLKELDFETWVGCSV